MIYDKLNTFATATSVAAEAGTALIGDVIDLQGLGGDEAAVGGARDVGNGDTVYLVIVTKTEIITGGTAGTVKFQLASDAQAAIAVDGSATVHYDTGTFVTDDAAVNSDALNVGGVIACVALPAEGNVYERYLGILCVTATTTTTSGAIDAFLTTDPHGYKHYPQGQVA